MSVSEHFARKFQLDLAQPSPIWIQRINRALMAETLAELGYTVGVEVGVANGDHSRILLDHIPNLKLYGVDAWTNYEGYRGFRANLLRDWHQLARDHLSSRNFVEVNKFSMDAVRDFADGSLDFVYLDAGHDFKNIAMDICEWRKKVRSGGILFGHDYECVPSGPFECHVQFVVNAYAVSHELSPWFVLGYGHRNQAQSIYCDGSRSWMFPL